MANSWNLINTVGPNFCTLLERGKDTQRSLVHSFNQLLQCYRIYFRPVLQRLERLDQQLPSRDQVWTEPFLNKLNPEIWKRNAHWWNNLVIRYLHKVGWTESFGTFLDLDTGQSQHHHARLVRPPLSQLWEGGGGLFLPWTPSLWIRVDLDWSDHLIIFHCSSLFPD